MIGGIIVVALLIALGAFGPKFQGNEFGARRVARDAVRRLLKAPSTASFPEEEQRVWNTGPGKWVVKGDVDAQNSFGAVIRAPYGCWVEYVPDAETYRITSLEFDGTTYIGGAR